MPVASPENLGDDELMAEAMRASGKKTKRETVEEGLRLLIHVRRQDVVRRFRGRLKWEGDLDRMRRDPDRTRRKGDGE